MLTVTNNSSKVKPVLRAVLVGLMAVTQALCTTGYSGQFNRIGQGVNPMGKAHWASDWNVGVRVWVERAGDAVIGEGRGELLAAIDAEHSITKAARAAGMSYRRAWNLIQAVNAAAGEPLVAAVTGGQKGGGARLTPRGRLALAVYESVRTSMIESAGSALRSAIAPDQSPNAVVHVAAAISLQEAIGQILAEYALERPDMQTRVVFGASNELADHLLAGAPGGLFISAEQNELKRLQAANLLVPKSARAIATNGLTIVGAANTGSVRNAKELLSERFKRVVLADPACPLGNYSKQYLTRAKLYDELLPKVLHVDNSRAILAAIASGAAQAGVAFSSDAARGGKWQSLLRVPAKQAAATYAAAIVGRGQKHSEAQKLLDYVTSPAGAKCLKRCGFTPATQVRLWTDKKQERRQTLA